MRSIVPENIAQALKAKSLTLKTLSGKIGCSVPTCRDILCGNKVLRPSILRSLLKIKIENELGIDLI